MGPLACECGHPQREHIGQALGKYAAGQCLSEKAEWAWCGCMKYIPTGWPWPSAEFWDE